MNESDLLIIPAIYQGGRDQSDRTVKICFVTNEITPSQAAELRMCVQNFVYLAIKLEPFTKEEVDMITDLKSTIDDVGKTPSQRLRGVLYRLWELNNEGYRDFNLYYNFKMEGFINHLKAKLD